MSIFVSCQCWLVGRRSFGPIEGSELLWKSVVLQAADAAAVFASAFAFPQPRPDVGGVSDGKPLILSAVQLQPGLFRSNSGGTVGIRRFLLSPPRQMTSEVHERRLQRSAATDLFKIKTANS